MSRLVSSATCLSASAYKLSDSELQDPGREAETFSLDNAGEGNSTKSLHSFKFKIKLYKYPGILGGKTV